MHTLTHTHTHQIKTLFRQHSIAGVQSTVFSVVVAVGGVGGVVVDGGISFVDLIERVLQTKFICYYFVLENEKIDRLR